MKILGHPLHMMLIHFPAALLPMDVLLSFFAYYNNDSSFLGAAFYCLAGGVVIGGIAIVTGLIDLVLIPRDKKQAMGTALIHGFMNALVVLFFGIFAYRGWQSYPQISMPSLSILVIKAILLMVLFVGNYLGGKLILQHRVGVKNIGG
jgi:uncharacterized membrane protein